MAELSCTTEVYGIGDPCGQNSGVSTLSGLLLLKPGFTFATGEAFATEATVLAAIAAKNALPIVEIDSQEPMNSEDRIYTAGSGKKTFLGNGTYGTMVKATLTAEQHKIVSTYSDKRWTLVKLDRENNMEGVLNTDLTVTGYSLGYFHVYPQTDATETEPEFTNIEFQLLDINQKTEKRVIVNPTWLTSTSIRPLTLVTATQSGTISAFTSVIDVAYKPTTKLGTDGAATSIAITGLTETTNWQIIDQGGAVEVVSITESATIPGRYTLVGVDITSGTAQVIATATDLFESAVITLV